MESIAVNEIFKNKPLCISTKPLMGHTLSAPRGLKNLDYVGYYYPMMIPFFRRIVGINNKILNYTN